VYFIEKGKDTHYRNFSRTNFNSYRLHLAVVVQAIGLDTGLSSTMGETAYRESAVDILDSRCLAYDRRFEKDD